MKRYIHFIFAVVLALLLNTSAFAEGEGELPFIPSSGSSPATESSEAAGETGVVELPFVPSAQEMPVISETPVTPTPVPSPTPVPANENSGSSGSSTGGYASPIVNIEAIEVPLADGTTIVLPFLDVPQDAYSTEGVAWAYSHDPQITDGVSAERFDPLATCTRGQMVTFLWRAAGCPEPTGTASAFSDVTAGAYYEKAVAWAVENGITDGVGGGRFDPNGIVNRAQAVTFLYRAKGKPAVTSAAQFTDVAAGEYYADAVAWAVANEVTNGVSDNAFAPNNNCVRGQTVTFLYRAYK